MTESLIKNCDDCDKLIVFDNISKNKEELEIEYNLVYNKELPSDFFNSDKYAVVCTDCYKEQLKIDFGSIH